MQCYIERDWSLHIKFYLFGMCPDMLEKILYRCFENKLDDFAVIMHILKFSIFYTGE